MPALLQHLHQQLAQYQPNRTHFLVALSGGIDSVVLLHLLSQLPLNLRAIHVHHGLSPNADSWADFCEQLCKRLNIPFILQKVSVQGSKGIEDAARHARYQAIQAVRQANETVVTAHHQGDQVETFFLALKRGSGAKGLAAMPVVGFWQNMPLFRPLLAIKKDMIQAYAVQHQLEWVEDESNQSEIYDRNFLRNAVLPTLNKRWPHFDEMVYRTTDHLNQQQQLLDELLAETLTPYINPTNHALNIADFGKFSLAKQQALLRLWLSQQQQMMPSQAQLSQIIKQMIISKSDKQPEIQLGDKWLRRYQQQLFLTRTFEPTEHFHATLFADQTIELPDNIGTLVRKQAELRLETDTDIKHYTLPSALANEELTVKLHHSGLVAQYAKPHREQMKKIWQAQQIPVWERSRTPLIFWQAQLVCVLS